MKGVARTAITLCAALSASVPLAAAQEPISIAEKEGFEHCVAETEESRGICARVTRWNSYLCDTHPTPLLTYSLWGLMPAYETDLVDCDADLRPDVLIHRQSLLSGRHRATIFNLKVKRDGNTYQITTASPGLPEGFAEELFEDSLQQALRFAQDHGLAERIREYESPRPELPALPPPAYHPEEPPQ